MPDPILNCSFKKHIELFVISLEAYVNTSITNVP